MRYLVRERKGIAHIWDGVDTLCRMYSTGGINKHRQRNKWVISDDKMNRKVCLMCVKGKSVQREKPSQVKSRPINKFYQSREWKDLRYQAFVKHGNRCMCCGGSPQDGYKLQVDHIKPRSYYPELALDINNLQILCASCNLGKFDIDETDWRQHMEEIVKYG